MKINYFNESNYNINGYKKIINSVFEQFKTDNSIFNIIFVDADKIKEINKTYRNIDRVTDVISFALNDNDEMSNIASNELGDIFICVSRAKEQAHEYGHSEKREIAFLSVHGFLHLSGYDHMTEEEEKVMFAKQKEILEKANIRR